MPRYEVEIVTKGRINIFVEAENEHEAENLALNSPEYPDWDKLYEEQVWIREVV